MPKVGDKEFKYDKAGIAAAKKESAKTGMPMSDGSMRSEKMYAGGGQTGYNKIGMMTHGGITMDKKMMGHGGAMKDRMMYKEGDMVPKKKKSGDDTLHPAVKEFGKEVSLAFADLSSAAFKAPSKIVKGVKKSVKQIKDSAYKEQVEVKDGTKTGKKRRKKLFKDKK